MTLEEAKEQALSTAEAEATEVEEEETSDAVDDYTQAIQLLEDAAELLDQIGDTLEMKLPIDRITKRCIAKLADDISDFITYGGDDDEDEDGVD